MELKLGLEGICHHFLTTIGWLHHFTPLLDSSEESDLDQVKELFATGNYESDASWMPLMPSLLKFTLPSHLSLWWRHCLMHTPCASLMMFSTNVLHSLLCYNKCYVALNAWTTYSLIFMLPESDGVSQWFADRAGAPNGRISRSPLLGNSSFQSSCHRKEEFGLAMEISTAFTEATPTIQLTDLDYSCEKGFKKKWRRSWCPQIERRELLFPSLARNFPVVGGSETEAILVASCTYPHLSPCTPRFQFSAPDMLSPTHKPFSTHKTLVKIITHYLYWL